MEQREQECGCLSRSGLGLTRDVLAFECHRQSLALNRRALNEAGFSNSFLQSCRQWEVGEAEIGEMMALCGGFDIGPRYLQIRFSAVKNTVRPPIYPLYSCELRGKHLPQIVPDPPGGVTFRLSSTGYYRLSPIRPRGPSRAAKKSRGFSIVSGEIVHTTDAAFEQDVVKSAQPVLLDFWAEWCGPCKMIAPILDTIATDYKDKLRVVKLNIDENPKTPPKFNIRGIPTLLLFRNGTVAAQQVGAVSKAQLESFLEKHLNGQHIQANKTA